MKEIKEYHLNEGESRGSLKVFNASPYVEGHGVKAFRAHRHHFYQLIWFTSKGQHFIDYETFEHPENALFFIDKGQVHFFCDQSPNEGYLFHFNDAFLNRYEFSNENWMHYRLFHELTSPFLTLEGELLSKVDQINRLLMQELDKKDFHFEQQCYFLFRLILLYIERVKRDQNQALIHPKRSFNEVAKFHQLTEKHLSENLPIDFYANELSMSTKKLTKLISKYLGNTPANIINQKKANEAKRLLSNSSLSIKEVGYELGFSQATYFTKFFKKRTGHTPKEFKKLIETGNYAS